MTDIPEILAKELKDIVLAETSAGNSICQVDSLWPRPGAVCVQLSHRFLVKHCTTDVVRYVEDTDPHGPLAEYVHVESGQSVLCSLFR